MTHRANNVPLLKNILATYGTCAILARVGDQIVGFLRFYPKILYSLEGAGALCLQQAFPAGPSQRLVEECFPSLDDLPDKTLTVHCMMTGSPFQPDNPYQRRGLGTHMACELVRWGTAKGWARIEASANEDLDLLYAHTGQAGKRFWGKLGFRVVHITTRPRFHGVYLAALRAQAVAYALDPDDVHNLYTMRLDLR